MNKIANFVNFFRVLGAQTAIEHSNGHEKTAFARSLGKLVPKSRIGKLGLAGLGGAGAVAAYKANQDQPSTLESMYEGGKEMLSEMSPEEMMGYVNLARSLGGGDYSMGYDALSADYPMEMAYADPSDSMGYEAQMSPEEMQQYLSYYGA